MSPWLTLPADTLAPASRIAVGAGVRGGALYDALIAATAVHHSHRLLSARRAAATYTALGISAVFIVSASSAP